MPPADLVNVVVEIMSRTVMPAECPVERVTIFRNVKTEGRFDEVVKDLSGV